MNWLELNPYRPPDTGDIVRYVGSQQPQLAGMEGIVQRVEPSVGSTVGFVRVTVNWRNGWETAQPAHELKRLRRFSKRFSNPFKSGQRIKLRVGWPEGNKGRDMWVACKVDPGGKSCTGSDGNSYSLSGVKRWKSGMVTGRAWKAA